MGMSEYIVTVQRTQSADVRVEASSEADALDRATAWDVLTNADFVTNDGSYEATSATLASEVEA
jgi:hypothetical protein